MIENETTYNDSQLCNKISENTDAYVEKIDDITNKLISQTTLLSILGGVNSSPSSPTSYENLIYNRELSGITSNTITLTSFPLLNVYIYSKNGKYTFIYNQNSSNFPLVMKDPYDVNQLNNRQMIIFPANQYTKGYDGVCSISFLRPIFDVNAKAYGYVEVQADYTDLDKICDIGNTGEVMILNTRNQMVYPSGKIDERTRELLVNKTRNQPNGVFKDNSGNIYFYSSSDYSGLTVFIKYSPSAVNSSLSLLENATYIIVGIVTLVSLLLVFLFSKLLVKPLRDLRNSILDVSYENMGLTISSTNNNEIIMLRKSFQHILDELKTAVEKEIASNKAEAKARVAALQAQIAPHFIHNVLYTIGIAAQEHQTDVVVSMCKQLSDMLRYTVDSSSQTVRLEDELRCIDNYLSLQSKNYEDFLFYEVQMQNQTKDIAIPRLSIQPFVENAMRYAFKNRKPPYKIQIVCEMKDSRWSISVIDNGNGVEKSTLDQINKRLEESASFTDCVQERKNNSEGMCGMGIVNSVLRLKMLYGESFKFSIDNNADGGTTVYLEGNYDGNLIQYGSNFQEYKNV